MVKELELPASADFHVHLRDGLMMETVVPTIRQGGVNIVYVMPNLHPPITTVQQALDYRSRLEALEPNVTFLMTLYLHSSITPSTISEAAHAGIRGVKSYPRGLTTNSSAGVVDYAFFYPVFAAMEEEGLVLNLHGESPSAEDITILNAEEHFLPTLLDLHHRFPKLRIVLEHLTTAAAVAAVKACGPTVAGTITAHHLSLTVDDWADNPHCFCKPVAKLPSDRAALLQAAASGDSKFFLGTDSAPHPVAAKRGGHDGRGKTVAGVFTQPYATQLVVGVLENSLGENFGAAALEGFLGGFGTAFYRVEHDRRERIVLKKEGQKVREEICGAGGRVVVIPFRRGEEVWSLEWKSC